MQDWLPIIVGALIIVVAIAVMRLAPSSAWGSELRRSYGVQPTGTRGIRTRRDHLRSAGFAALLAVLLEMTSMGVGELAFRYPEESRASIIAQTYTFAAFLLAAMAAVSMLRSLWKAAVWRVELPDTP